VVGFCGSFWANKLSQKMDEGMELQLSLDKLPIKRLDSIEENGIERFPP
jgi:hypothetical protein